MRNLFVTSFRRTISEAKELLQIHSGAQRHTKITMMLSSAVSSTKGEVVNYLDAFAKYMFLWKEDRELKIKVPYV